MTGAQVQAQAPSALLTMPQLPSPLRLATSLDVTTIRDICRPLFDTINSQTSTFVWAGVFGSVSRGTQRDSSEVDILLGYAPNARFFEDVCGDMGILVDQLPEVLGLRVDVIQHVQDRSMGIVQVEALLSAKTIWGNEQWLPPQRDKAESVLRQSYQKLNEAERMMRAVRQRVLRSKVRNFFISLTL